MNNMKLLYEIVIPYPYDKIRISNSRKPKYISSTAKLNKTEESKLKSGEYTFKPFKIIKEGKKAWKNYLCDTVNGLRIVKNKKTVGKAKDITINGQALYNGTYKDAQRGMLMDKIHKHIDPFILKTVTIPIKDYPLSINLIYYDLEGTKLPDLDNRSWPMFKVIQDCLEDHKLIVNDNSNYITKITADQEFVSNITDSRLMISIWKKK